MFFQEVEIAILKTPDENGEAIIKDGEFITEPVKKAGNYFNSSEITEFYNSERGGRKYRLPDKDGYCGYDHSGQRIYQLIFWIGAGEYARERKMEFVTESGRQKAKDRIALSIGCMPAWVFAEEGD